MDRQGKAYVLGGATVLLWSTVATAFKLSLRELSPLELLFFACLASLFTLFAILAGTGRLRLLAGLSARDWLRCALLGALNPFLYYVVLFRAYDLLPAQQAQPLNYTWAVTLSLLSVPLLGQKLARRDLAAILVSYLGVVVISTKGDILGLDFDSPAGVAYALGSTVIWALYWIYNAKSEIDPVVGLFLNFVFGFILIAVAMAATRGFGLPSAAGLLGAAYVGVFEMGVTFVLWLGALKLSTSSAKVANLIFFSPFLSLVFIHFLVGEPILASTVAGLGLIIAGNLIQTLGKR